MTDQNIDPKVDPRDAPPRGGKAKRVPPLVWIILGLLVLAVVIGALQRQGTHVTPGGGEMPQAQAGDPVEAVMPPTNDTALSPAGNAASPPGSAAEPVNPSAEYPPN